MIDLDLDNSGMLVEDIFASNGYNPHDVFNGSDMLVGDVFNMYRYNPPILLDKDDLPVELNIASIVYDGSRSICEYCGTLHYTKNCLLLATP